MSGFTATEGLIGAPFGSWAVEDRLEIVLPDCHSQTEPRSRLAGTGTAESLGSGLELPDGQGRDPDELGLDTCEEEGRDIEGDTGPF